MPGPVVRVSGLAKSYGSERALDGVDLEVQPGEIFGLVGPNGAGKTTTLQVLATLVRPDAGTAELMGHDVIRAPDAARAALGYVPQELVADRSLTGRENLKFFCELYHVPLAVWSERIERLLELHLEGV